MTESMSNALARLNKIAASASKPKRTSNVAAFLTEMARRGYAFSESSLELARAYCSGVGLCVHGPVGVGKTFFFQLTRIPCFNLKVAQGRKLEDIQRALESYQDYPILIDDVGIEELDYKSYGTPVKLLDYAIEMRLDASARTHFTTNLTVDQIVQRYGTRTVDRLTQLARWVELGGESRRSPTSATRDTSWFSDFYLGRVWKPCADRCRFYDQASRRCMKGRDVQPKTDADGLPVCNFF